MLQNLLDNTLQTIRTTLEERSVELRPREIGRLTEVGGGIAQVKGLPGIRSEELVEFPGGLLGIAINLTPSEVGVILLGESEALSAGVEVRATHRETDTPVGENLIGRVVDATGRALDRGKPIRVTERRPVERPARPVIQRAPVSAPLQTGIKAVDALIPIGRGQRELIVGDRQTGKTSVAVDTLINQKGKGVIGVYCAIGQRGTAVARVVETLREHGALEHTIVVVASGESPPGLRFITPYAATSMAEYFMEKGQDVVIVYDDLTRHARAYRELSLLLRRPPGREAYPGDIFYIHSRLLERATHLSEEEGGGSLTALPIVETQAQDISAYIPTNLISITDGQIYFSPTLFSKVQLPAIDIGKSVSRVGGKAQFPAYREVSGDLKLAYAQFEELETFARFATRLDPKTRATIEHGRRVREVLKQNENDPQSAAAQISVLKAVTEGLFDDLPLEEVRRAEQKIQDRVLNELPQLCERIEKGEKLDESDWDRLIDACRKALQGVEPESSEEATDPSAGEITEGGEEERAEEEATEEDAEKTAEADEEARAGEEEGETAEAGEEQGEAEEEKAEKGRHGEESGNGREEDR